MSQHAADQLHRPEVWSSVAPGYDEAIAPIMHPYAITALDLLGLTGGRGRVRLLDVAAGTGVVALEAARRGAEVLATDFAPGMVEVMRRRFAAEGLDARAEVMDGQALDLEDESFDLGTSTFGLMFFPDPLVGLQELRRVLRPGGRVGIAAWDMTRVGLPQLLRAALARAVPDLPAPAAPPWAHLCEAAGLGQALRTAGFNNVAVHQVTHHWPLAEPGLFFRHLPDWTPPRRPLFTSLPPEAIDHAAAAFADVVRERSTTEGMPQAALIGIGARRETVATVICTEPMMPIRPERPSRSCHDNISTAPALSHAKRAETSSALTVCAPAGKHGAVLHRHPGRKPSNAENGRLTLPVYMERSHGTRVAPSGVEQQPELPDDRATRTVGRFVVGA